jgi:hypothetical protein
MNKHKRRKRRTHDGFEAWMSVTERSLIHSGSASATNSWNNVRALMVLLLVGLFTAFAVASFFALL